MNEDLLCTLAALRSPSSRLVDETPLPYSNRKNVWGHFYVLWHAGSYHLISVSNCTMPPTLEQLAKSIEMLPELEAKRCGFYKNKKDNLGYYASGKGYGLFDGMEHWFMVSHADRRWIANKLATLRRMRRSERLSEDSEDLLDYLEQRENRRRETPHELRPSLGAKTEKPSASRAAYR